MLIRMVDQIKNIEKLVTGDGHLQNVDDIKRWLDILQVNNYTINSDYTVDVRGDVTLYDKGLNKLPVKFGTVTGSFNVGGNFIKTLHNCPDVILDGTFYAHNNISLTSLLGGPRRVNGDYHLDHNPQLISLAGIAPVITGSLSGIGALYSLLQGIIGTKDIYHINHYPVPNRDYRALENMISNLKNIPQYENINMESVLFANPYDLLHRNIIDDDSIMERIQKICKDDYADELLEMEYLWCEQIPIVFKGIYDDVYLENRKDELITMLVKESVKNNIQFDSMSDSVNEIAKVALSGNHKLN